MTTERYRRIYNWFSARPAAKKILLAANTAMPLFLAVLYGVLLAKYGLEWYRGIALLSGAEVEYARNMFWRAVLIPAVTLAGGTMLRNRLNWPRPYAQPDYTPLKQKEGEGCSMPSRHALSAGVIASVWIWTMPRWGVFVAAVMLCVCALRVLVGVHYIRDVAAGAALGFLCGMLILLP